MPSPLPPPRRPLQKSASVAERLENAILAGQFAMGQRLPSEAELGERFLSSRTVIREALKRIEARGIVQTINGSGSYVRGVTVSELEASLHRYTTMMPPGDQFGELFDLRVVIESGAAALLAERHNPVQLEPVTLALAELERARDDLAEFASALVAFHLALVTATGNHLMQAVHRSLEPRMRRAAGESVHDFRCVALLLAEHRTMYQLIADGDPTAASAAVRTHLLTSRPQHQGAPQRLHPLPALI